MLGISSGPDIGLLRGYQKMRLKMTCFMEGKIQCYKEVSSSQTNLSSQGYSNQIPTRFSWNLTGWFEHLYGRGKGWEEPRFSEKNIVGEFVLANNASYYKAIIIKRMWLNSGTEKKIHRIRCEPMDMWKFCSWWRLLHRWVGK